MKKPPSHIAGIVLFSLFVLVGIFQAQHSISKFNAPLYTTLIFPAFFSIGLYGLLRVRKWSRVFCSISIAFIIVAFIAIPFFNNANPDQFYPTLFMGIIVAALLSWWLYSFTFGNNSKGYFEMKNT